MTTPPPPTYTRSNQSGVDGREPDDVIPLTRYWNILVRNRSILAFCFALGIAGGIVYLRIRSVPPFQHVAVVEVGSTMKGDPLESMAQVVARAESTHIPAAFIANGIREQVEQPYQVKVQNPKDSTVIRIEAYGQTQDTAAILKIEQKIADAMIEDHRKLIGMMRVQLRDDFSRAERDLESLRVDEKFFPEKLKRIEAATKLLQQQIADTRSLIERAEAQRAAIIHAEADRASNSESIATAFLLIDADLQKKREQLAAMEERLSVQFKEQREGVEKAILENRRAQENQKPIIESVRLQIENLRESRIVIPPSRLFRSPSHSYARVMLIAGMLGLLIGGCAALFREFMRIAAAERVAHIS